MDEFDFPKKKKRTHENGENQRGLLNTLSPPPGPSKAVPAQAFQSSQTTVIVMEEIRGHQEIKYRTFDVPKETRRGRGRDLGFRFHHCCLQRDHTTKVL